MILKSYSKQSNNLFNLHRKISASGFVENFTGLTGEYGTIEINGDSIIDEAALDSLVNSYQTTFVPDEITPRQARQALILNGISIETVEAALNSLSEPQRSLAIQEWEYSASFQRHRPLVLSVATALGWNEDQLDQLWIGASQL